MKENEIEKPKCFKECKHKKGECSTKLVCEEDRPYCLFCTHICVDCSKERVRNIVQAAMVPAEMTPEHWEREEREVTIYGIKDEFGGL